jgi:O-antigen ligase
MQHDGAEAAVPGSPADPPIGVPEGNHRQDRTPWLLGFLCFFLTALPTYVVLPGPLKGNGGPTRIISVMMLGLAFLGFLLVRRTRRSRQINPGVVIILLYFLLWLLVFAVGLEHVSLDDPFDQNGPGRTRGLITLVSHVGVALYVFALVQTPRQRKIVLGCIAVGLAFACLVGLFQAVSSIDLRFVFKFPGLIVNGEDLPLSDRMGVKRATGTSQHAIEFSVLAAVAVPMTIYFARRSATRNRRLFFTVACVLALFAVPATVSRTGLISLAAALLIYMFYFTVRQIAVAVVALLIAIGGYALAFPHILTALWSTVTGSLEDTSIQTRTERYVAVSQSFHEHPIFGLGLGLRSVMDNEWLQTILQGGLVGIAAMILLTLGTIFGVTAALRRATTPDEREQAYMLGAVTVGILIASATFDLLWYQQATLIFFVGFALLWAPFSIPVSESDDSAAKSHQQHPTDRPMSHAMGAHING